jgi:hypothetical protein
MKKKKEKKRETIESRDSNKGGSGYSKIVIVKI